MVGELLPTGIVDSHQQLWDPATGRLPPSAVQVPDLRGPFLPEHLRPLLTSCGVTRTVAIHGHASAEDTQWLLALADRTPFIGAVIGWVDLTAPDAAAALDGFAANAKFRGVRVRAADAQESGALLHPDLVRGLRGLAARGLVLDLLPGPRDLRSLPGLTRAVPDLRIVLEHLASPNVVAGTREPWGTYLAQLADCPNVWCKLSGVGVPIRAGLGSVQLAPYVDKAARAFGYDRLMWGSDWPVSTLAVPYERTLSAIVEALGPVTDSQLARVFAGSAREFYRLA